MTSDHIKAIDHVAVAVAVRDGDAAMRYYIDTLGLELICDEIADDPGVRLIYLAAGADKLQLVQSVRPGPVARWLDEHGEGLHHICFQVDDIPAVLDELEGRQTAQCSAEDSADAPASSPMCAMA